MQNPDIYLYCLFKTNHNINNTVLDDMIIKADYLFYDL